jgi:hypothetical protein
MFELKVGDLDIFRVSAWLIISDLSSLATLSNGMTTQIIN